METTQKIYGRSHIFWQRHGASFRGRRVYQSAKRGCRRTWTSTIRDLRAEMTRIFGRARHDANNILPKTRYRMLSFAQQLFEKSRNHIFFTRLSILRTALSRTSSIYLHLQSQLNHHWCQRETERFLSSVSTHLNFRSNSRFS